MPLARIRTQFPEEVQELCEALMEAGYVVETVRPNEVRISPADLELTVDKLPVIEAWRNIPDADTVYVAPGTPESRDVRSGAGRHMSREARFAGLLANLGETAHALSRWSARQWREARARGHEWRERLTPPREYHSPPHLEPTDLPSESVISIDAVIERLRRQRNSRERAEKELAERVRKEAESRRRTREAAEAKALLEEQQKIEHMVRATAELREKVFRKEDQPKPERRLPRPRRLLRTRRDRAFVRAGVAAFSLSLGLALLAGEALHPRPVSTVVPTVATTTATPFAKQPVTAPTAADTAAAAEKPPSALPTLAKPAVLADPVITADAKPPQSKRDNTIADDEVEVIVRKATVTRPHPKSKSRVAHYSDLD
ncbi:hypothetical protein Acid345_2034 [Candidatus Koribacter versatilis Ellin345]|uniref:Uncharacterized protein n=1 Tax=Koribacter versatilis (strain Ellin345) TaxID=204669 RepID=Q1IQ15_KORVE|nr:hypothetical protein [Candidatus Koribacter versatilis]ABF41035.1 hypothetical protein Acid345_2034 [Candidatus Koribacter versatilis Ellin345]